jgi:hypothetical protein
MTSTTNPSTYELITKHLDKAHQKTGLLFHTIQQLRYISPKVGNVERERRVYVRRRFGLNGSSPTSSGIHAVVMTCSPSLRRRLQAVQSGLVFESRAPKRKPT